MGRGHRKKIKVHLPLDTGKPNKPNKYFYFEMHVLEGGGRILGTGGTDGTVKVWDLEHQFYTHNFRFASLFGGKLLFEHVCPSVTH